MMQTSTNGIKFIAIREAIVTTAYEDGSFPDGRPKYSIGAGSQDPMPKLGDTISIADAFERLKLNVHTRDLVIQRAIKVAITQGMWDALASLYYQSGSKALAAIAEMFNNGPATWAIAEFLKWNHGANKVRSEGHTKRRIREMIMALDGNYGDLSKVMVFDGDPRQVKPTWMPFPDSL